MDKGLSQISMVNNCLMTKVAYQQALLFESGTLSHFIIKLQLMSSNSTVKTLLTRNLKVSEHLLLSTNNSTYSSYQEDLDNNLRFILKKYSHLDRKKVSDLLEELDNNKELAMQILDAEESHCNSNMEEHRHGARQSTLSLEEENTIFKRAYLSLYKKRQAVLRELEEVRKKYESERAENEKLKQMNKYLIHCDMNRNLNGEDFPSVC